VRRFKGATREHERNISHKKNLMLKKLQVQVDAIQTLIDTQDSTPEVERISADKEPKLRMIWQRSTETATI
jgi:hypothetical protein